MTARNTGIEASLYDPEVLSRLHVPTADNEPVFSAPWEASAFALLLALHKKGYFDWNTWVATFSAEIKAAEEDGDPCHSYYQIWSRALEKMISSCGLLGPREIDARTQLWRRAYLSTPHGMEVLLDNGR